MKEQFTNRNFPEDSNAVLSPDSWQAPPQQAVLEFSNEFTILLLPVCPHPRLIQLVQQGVVKEKKLSTEDQSISQGPHNIFSLIS